MKPLPLLTRLEVRAGLGPVDTASLLGLSRPGYFHLRNRNRKMQGYIKAHIDTLMRVPHPILDALIKERVHGG